MRATPSRLLAVCLGLSLLLLLALLAGLWLGTVSIGPGQFWQWLSGRLEGPSAIILGQLRLPRLLLAALVGACLGLSGAVFQAILRNPLAEPFILGVSGGAACGAVVSVLVGLSGLWGQSALAFGGGPGHRGLGAGHRPPPGQHGDQHPDPHRGDDQRLFHRPDHVRDLHHHRPEAARHPLLALRRPGRGQPDQGGAPAAGDPHRGGGDLLARPPPEPAHRRLGGRRLPGGARWSGSSW